MANPAPWAVTVFAATSFVLGMFQTGLLNNAGVLIVLPVRCSAPTGRSG